MTNYSCIACIACNAFPKLCVTMENKLINLFPNYSINYYYLTEHVLNGGEIRP